MQSVWAVPSTVAASTSSNFVAHRVVRSYRTTPADAGIGTDVDALRMVGIGGAVAAAAAGRRLASGRSAAPGQVRGALVAVRADKGNEGTAATPAKATKEGSAPVTAKAKKEGSTPATAKAAKAAKVAKTAKPAKPAKVTKVDAIKEEAAELTEATYPFMCEVPWNSQEFSLTPGRDDPIHWAKAIGKIINMGADMDAELVKAGCDAHHLACTDLPSNGVCSKAKLTEIYAAIGRMIASVQESQTMEVYESVKALVDPAVPAYLMSKVTEANARAAYDALIKFTAVVKAHPITPSAPTTVVSVGAASSINRAASELGKAAYPFMQGIDWTDDLWAKPVPKRSAQDVLKAVDKMIVMGTKMDGAALKEAARAHVKAIEGMDAKGLLTEKDFEDILAGLGKVISSVPARNVMDVYNEMSGLTISNSGLPTYIFSRQNPINAIAAYQALMKFKDTVKAYQPNPIDLAAEKLARETYPFMQEVPWNSPDFLLTPGMANPIAWTDAIGTIIDMGASMDVELVKAGCEAHHAAIVDLPDNGVCSEAQLKDIYAAIGRMIASVPTYKTMTVYDKVSALVDRKVPEYLMSKVTEKNARAAYKALIQFTNVVKKNPITPCKSETSVSEAAASNITAAASKLAKTAYPFMKGVDWTDCLWAKAPPGKDAREVLKAVDKMIVMGLKMDGPALQEAARAHVRAIKGMDTQGVLTHADFEAILAGLGKVISSVPENSVMDVYDEMNKLAGESTEIPQYIYSMQNPVDAMAAYSALMQFKDTVRAYQPDAIGVAAAKLSNASYPFMQQVPWNSTEFLLPPGTANPIGWAGAIGKIIDMGASMDGELVKAGCEAHHAAIIGLPSTSSVCSQAQLTEIYATIGRMIASVPESKTMDVYNAVNALVDPKVPEYLMSKVTEADARAAYDALIEFTEVVKANPIKPSDPTTVVSSSNAGAIGAAASELGKAAYPFMTGIDWTDDLWTMAPPGKSAREVLKAVDKMIVMGSKMDWAALQEAARAHVKAIEGMDAKGVLTPGDLNAILAGLGKAISSVPEQSVMEVYNQMNELAGPSTGIPEYIYSKQNQTDAMTAYSALLQFKDTVKAAQPKPPRKLFVDTAEEWQLDPAVFSMIIFLGATLPNILVPAP